MQKQSTTGKRTAFVTGASYGIGAATALALARNGFDVAVAATRVENLSNVVAQLETTGARVVPLALDLCANSSIEQTMAAVTGAFGNLDVLVNNASVPLRKAAAEVTPQEWDAVMQPNLTGTFFMCQQMGRHLIGSGRPGCIINMASTHGIVALAERLVYGVSKAAVMHMTKMLAIEWAQHGIRVNSIAPGTVDTPSRAAFLADPKTREMMLNRVPLHRLGTADEVAAAVCYLASPEAAYITGHTLIMDGGLTAY